MNASWLLLILAAALTLLMIWAFRTLPREEWQILACVPRKKDPAGSWSGLNLTFYGFFTANACVFAAAVFLLLMGSAGVPVVGSLAMLAALLSLCVPASRCIARRVDKTRSGFTVGGASFVGLLGAPLAVYLVNFWAGGFQIPLMPALAATAIAYCFGESAGRLACISFGCCYGKPLQHAGPRAARIFGRFHFVFHGATRKIAYASGLQGIRVIPVQALTAMLFSLLGLTATALFFHSQYAAAFALTTLVSQTWRVYSETLRADYRGGGRISAYQVMAALSVVIAGLFALILPAAGHVRADVVRGLWSLWSPGILLLLEFLWLGLFLFMGRSETTASVLSFHVNPSFKNSALGSSDQV
jgi:hypothetical protein